MPRSDGGRRFAASQTGVPYQRRTTCSLRLPSGQPQRVTVAVHTIRGSTPRVSLAVRLPAVDRQGR